MPKPVTVKDYMSTHYITLAPDMDVLNAIHQLIENRISGAPVIDKHGNLIGFISEKDCIRTALNASYHSESAGKVAEYMSADVKTVEADNDICSVAAMFVKDGYRRYPVMDDNRLI